MNMKKSILSVVCAVLSLAILSAHAGPGPESAVSKEKTAVDKVLAGHLFTPPVTIAGPNNLEWFVAARSGRTNSLEQIVVSVRGQAINIQMTTYERNMDGSWKAHEIPPAHVAGLVKTLQEEIRAELAK
jgi:hypothetical protein